MGSPLPVRPDDPPADKARVHEENRWRRGRRCMEPISGEGWKSAVRVRLLHGVVRRRVMKTVEKDGAAGGMGGKPAYDFEAGGFGTLVDGRRGRVWPAY
jgi:hypothetical protein